MQRGAEILVETCANVKAGERIAIVTDDARLPVAQAIEEAVEGVGGDAVVIVTPTRKIDNEEPSADVAEAMTLADVVFLPLTKSMTHTRATQRAIASGARVISLSAFTKRQMKEGGLFTDFHSRRPVCDAMAARLTQANGVRVINPAGTDLSFSIEGRVGNSHCCILEKPGFTAVPNIEANISPVEGTADGVLVVNGSIPYFGVGVIKEPVIFTIENGFVTEIQGGAQASFIRELLAQQEDRYVYNIAQFAMGLNPACVEFTGEMLNDEGIDGTIHMGIGTSANLGGMVRSKTHFDAIIRSPSVLLDGESIQRFLSA